MEKVMKVPFEVYRGEFEKIIQTNLAEIRLFKDSMEILMSYDYSFEVQQVDPMGTPMEPLIMTEICRMRSVMPKNDISVCESITFHPYDIKRESPVSVIAIDRGGRNDILIRCTKDEAARLYKILRDWILVNKS